MDIRVFNRFRLHLLICILLGYGEAGASEDKVTEAGRVDLADYAYSTWLEQVRGTLCEDAKDAVIEEHNKNVGKLLYSTLFVFWLSKEKGGATVETAKFDRYVSTFHAVNSCAEIFRFVDITDPLQWRFLPTPESRREYLEMIGGLDLTVVWSFSRTLDQDEYHTLVQQFRAAVGLTEGGQK